MKTFYPDTLRTIMITLEEIYNKNVIVSNSNLIPITSSRRLWSQRDFSASDAGLTYTIAGIGSTRGQKQRRQRQQRHHTQRCSKGSTGSQRPNSAFMPESVCSSAQTQSTATATEKLEQQLHHHHQQQAMATQQQHHQYLNE